MIYFITDTDRHTVIPKTDLQILSLFRGREIADAVFNRIRHNDMVSGQDIEANGTEPYTTEMLLMAVGDEQDQIIIDTTSVDPKEILPTDYQEFTWLGHNLKYDYKVCKINKNIILKKFWDTMLVEQRLTQNCTKGGEGFYTINATLMRNFGRKPEHMNKDVRTEFYNANPKTFIFADRHILYSAGDISPLFELKRHQEAKIAKYNQWLLMEIENRLLRHLADAELAGFDLDTTAWLKIYEANKIKKHELAIELDEEVKRLRDTIVHPDSRFLLKGGKYHRKRHNYEVKGLDLFGNEATEQAITGKKGKLTLNKGNINYGSSEQIAQIFARLGEEMPTKANTYEVPILADDGTIENKSEQFTTGKEYAKVFIMEKPNSPMIPFVEKLLKYKKIVKRIDTYGKKFLTNFINPVTGKVHTIYRQCDAINGRLQSGDVDNGYYNSQNIPRDGEYRHCFIAPKGRSISSFDLSGAEAVIIVSKSGDENLKKWVADDIHGHLATQGWRAIYANRASRGIDRVKNEELSRTFLVTRELNVKTHRDPCKNLTYGGMYGCRATKAAKTIGSSIKEGQIYLNSMRRQFPKAYALMDRFSKQALKSAYLTIDTRTNARVWFIPVIWAIKNNEQLNFEDIIEVDGQARNTPISGTQANMIKEATVEICEYIEKHNLPCQLLHSVHDELVFSQDLNMDGESEEWKTNPRTVEYTSPEGEVTSVSFPVFVKNTMADVANRYLTNVKMDVNFKVANSWAK